MKPAIVGIFTPWELASAAYQNQLFKKTRTEIIKGSLRWSLKRGIEQLAVLNALAVAVWTTGGREWAWSLELGLG